MMTEISSKAWLGIGGNIGDVETAMAKALSGFDMRADTSVVKVSSIYKTPPWGVTDQPWFLNCCAEIETHLPPEHLLEICQEAERAGKRERIQRWGPRTIDVDILIYEGVEQIEQRLTIPHPRMGERAFVLIPLAEIAAELQLYGNTISELAKQLGDGEVENTESGNDWWRA